MAERNIAVTISGTDFNGFVWQNVFHLTSEQAALSIIEHLQATNEWVYLTIGTQLQGAMSEQVTILDVASRYVKPDSSYLVHKSVSDVGARAGVQQTGAAAGVIQWFPIDGPGTGRQYVSGCLDADFANDYISDDYIAILETLRDAFLNLTGTDGTSTWVFVLYSKGDDTTPPSTDPIVAGEPKNKIGILSKRVRA